MAVFSWVAITHFDTTLGRLHTSAGWLRLSGLLIVSLGEWTVGAGVLLGALFWSLRSRNPQKRDDSKGQHRVRH